MINQRNYWVPTLDDQPTQLLGSADETQPALSFPPDHNVPSEEITPEATVPDEYETRASLEDIPTQINTFGNQSPNAWDMDTDEEYPDDDNYGRSRRSRR